MAASGAPGRAVSRERGTGMHTPWSGSVPGGQSDTRRLAALEATWWKTGDRGGCRDSAARPAVPATSTETTSARFTAEDVYEREMAAFLDRLETVPGNRSRQRRDESRRTGLVLHPSLRDILRETAAKLSIEADIAVLLDGR